MKTLSLLLIQVLGVALCNAQYLYFNHNYFNDNWDSTYAFINVKEINGFYYGQAVGNASGEHVQSNIQLNEDGGIFEIFDSPNLNAQDTRWDRKSTMFVNDSVYVICPTRSGNCFNQMPHMTCFTLQNEMIWEKDFAEWEDCDQELFINPQKLLRISDTSFMFISMLRPYQLNPPTQFRFTEMNFDGSIISDHISTSSLWAYFNVNDVYHYQDNLIFIGADVNCGSYDVNIIKTDMEGTVLSDTCIGNPDDCLEPSGMGYINEDGTIQLVYSRCIEDQGVGDIISQLRSVKINLADWSIISDIQLPFSIFDDGLLTTAALFHDFIKVPWGGYVGTFNFHNNDASILYDAVIIRLLENGSLDWINVYQPPNGFGNATLVDIEATSDGGFLAVGSCNDFAPTFVERGWALKIDNCGYEEPSGCPEVVSIEGDGRHPELDSGSFTVWPNPFHAQLKAVLPHNANRVFISDATGRIVFEEKVFYPHQVWNLSALSDGVYVMSVELESGQVISERIVKR